MSDSAPAVRRALDYRVHLFAVLREKTGTDIWTCSSETPLSGSQLLGRFFEAHPALSAMRSVTRLAVNQAFCLEDPQLDPNDEIALIPPVSGG
ncbi:MoaD/ThiS family protein [Sulfidibacter corallicola]|uniref:Molybdopterin synthase sulfur carrier subunit n=1 Tax=Sulfidibacter corallicola TaxID=2818388 RepID=A0A8A4TMV7_SULCO|nr:MoaD/ThiS family protein [Sulfidibacter corallicola]QTD47925.1 MoaD/ThiS family protein [Sulfidibacter corallicola]